MIPTTKHNNNETIKYDDNFLKKLKPIKVKNENPVAETNINDNNKISDTKNPFSDTPVCGLIYSESEVNSKSSL